MSTSDLESKVYRTKDYTAYLTPQRDLVVTISEPDGTTHEIGGIINQRNFPHKWFTLPELELLKRFEEFAQETYAGLPPRKYSGLYPYSHIVRIADNAQQVAYGAGITQNRVVQLDLATYLGIIGHDLIEELIESNSQTQSLLGDWRDAVLSGDTTRRIEVGESLAERRRRLRDTIYDKLHEYVEQIHVSPQERTMVLEACRVAVNNIYSQTRSTNENPYAYSLGRQFIVKDGDTNVGETLRRIIGKSNDVRANLQEHQPSYSRKFMERIQRAFTSQEELDGVIIGDYLTQKFGRVNIDARQMPRVDMIQNVFNTIFAFYYFNSFLNKNAAIIVQGSNEVERDIFQLAFMSKLGMERDAMELLRVARGLYERDKDVRARKEEVEGNIRTKQRTNFYDEVTVLEGFTVKLLRWEAAGSAYRQSHDLEEDDKAHNYEIVRDLEILIPRFAQYIPKDWSGDSRLPLEGPAHYDPRKHDLFTPRGIEEIIERIRPDYWESVARLHARRGGKRTSPLRSIKLPSLF